MGAMPRFWRLAVVSLLAVGCGDGGNNGTELLNPGDGGTHRPDAGMVGPGPVVMVVSPSAAADPSSPAVITQDPLEVVCGAMPGKLKKPINPQTVVVNVYVDNKVVATQPATTEVNQYKASISLKDVAAGPIEIECTAADTAMEPLTGTARIATLLDHGPTITFASPKDMSAVAAAADVPVLFKVEPFKLGDSDPGAEPDPTSLTMRINGMTVVPTPTVGEANAYSYTIDFGDTKLFPGSMVTSTAIEVSAKNKRSPAPASATASIDLTVDGVGPVITPVNPISGQMVGGEVAVVVSVEDKQSGLKPGSIRFEIEHNQQVDPYEMELGTAPQYTGKFPAGKYLGRSQLTLNIIAEDVAGNQTRFGLDVELDSVPPWVSLDPLPVREVARTGAVNNPSCSLPFDPVGSGAVSDEDVLPPSIPARKDRYRALVWERGTAITGDTSVTVSGVKDDTVKVYVQSDVAVPLIIDSDKDPDHLCDSINAMPPLGQHAPVVLNYKPITPTGSLVKIGAPLDASELATDPPVVECTTATCDFGTCKVQGAATVPDPLCGGESDLTIVMQHRIPGTPVPVIYAFSPKAGTVPGCTGDLWESTITTGWTCVAGTARDNAGNVGISKPLRVCYGASCPTTPPDCTDGCVMPGVFTDQGMPRVIVR
jgi:hypothetical protein